MAKVNNSLGAIQGALTPYDEVAIFSYSNGSKEWTGFTGAQTNRVPAVLALAKAIGSEELVPINSGPFASCNIRENGNCVDPNLQAGPLNRQRQRRHHHPQGDSHPQRRHSGRGQGTLHPAQRPPPHHLRRSPTARSTAARLPCKEVLRYLADQQDRRLWHRRGHVSRLGRGLREPPPPALYHVRQHPVQVHLCHRRRPGLRARHERH